MSHSIEFSPDVARSAHPLRAALLILMALAVASVLSAPPAAAKVLDFGAALQNLPAGKAVSRISIDDRGWMRVQCRNDGGGPDLCIVFDSSDPTGGDDDLGTPNEEFGGPGEGEGGEPGGAGPNDQALGKLLVVAENDCDADHDGLVDEPDDESGGGVITLSFSHAGRVSFTLVDVDCDEEAPRFLLYHDDDLVEVAEGASPGDNGAQHVDLTSYGDLDKVKIALDGSAGIGALRLEVLQVGIEPSTWSAVKGMFR